MRSLLFTFFAVLLFSIPGYSQITSTAQVGNGTSGSSSRGPIDYSGSSTVYSRFIQVFTDAELAAAGIKCGDVITELQWYLDSENIITGAGNATFDIYATNSTATTATAVTWSTYVAGTTLVSSNTFNTTNNFPGVKGWMSFPLTTPITYNCDGSLEIAVDWDISGVSAPVLSGSGGFKWDWHSTTGNLVTHRTSSTAPPTNINDLQDERANIRFVHSHTPPTCLDCTVTGEIGTGTSSSSSRGPFQISGGTSTTRYSQWVMVYTAAELATMGIVSGEMIDQLKFDLNSSEIITGAGDISVSMYLKNSAATCAPTTPFSTAIAGSSLVFNQNFNTTNNFPGVKDWMCFKFCAPFTYTGGALEVAVNMENGSNVFIGTGATTSAIKWKYSPAACLASKRTSGSSPSTSNLQSQNDRANIQFTHTVPDIITTVACDCDNGVDNDGDGINELALETFTITATAGQTITLTTPGGLVDASGNPASGTATDNGNGTYTFTAYVPADGTTTYSAVFTLSGGGIACITGGPCAACPFVAPPACLECTVTGTIGTGTSSGSNTGPTNITGPTSSTRYSQWVMVYTAAELAAMGMTNGDLMDRIRFFLKTTNIITGAGDIGLTIYIKNSTATVAPTVPFATAITGSTLVYNQNFNTTNNFPGVEDWMEFKFSGPFTYTGGAIEVAVFMDNSDFPTISGDGKIKWVRSGPANLASKKTSGSAPSTSNLELQSLRPNIQYIHTVPETITTVGCDCANGVDTDGDGINDLALETFTIPATAGQTITLTTSGGLVDNTGAAASGTATDNGNGTYTYTAYVPADGTTTYASTFTISGGGPEDGDTPCVTGGPCAVCPATPASIDISDPCNCAAGIDSDGDGINELAFETITITAAAGQTITLTSAGGLLDATGAAASGIAVDNGNGTYTFTGYVPTTGVTYTAAFIVSGGGVNDGDTVSITGGPCPICPKIVPTLGEWGLISLALLLLITGMLFMTVPKMATTQGQEVSFPMIWNNLPFYKKIYFQILPIVAIAVLGFFTVIATWFGYEWTSADPLGILVTVPLASYMVMLVVHAERNKE